jgi:ubiquitin-protein ligase E3 A
MEDSTSYEGGFTKKSPVVKWFWEIFHKEFGDEERRKFLAFVSGTDRSPIGGLRELQLKIVKNGEDDDRLPSSHTCFNTLLLNNYTSKEKLKHWLSMAIDNHTGFGLQ